MAVRYRLAVTAMDPERVAWRTYYGHSSGCEECHRRLHNCPTGAALWEEYLEVRAPIPGARYPQG